ncbi:MAG: ABC transporter ATP-binding protein [Acidimicrobiales bacterium]
MAVIEVSDLRKRYGDVEAVRGVSLSIEEGEVFALLGPNGAGKSTAVEILEGHRERTSGEVSVLGMDPATGGREFRDRIGIVLQSSGIEDELSVNEALAMYGSTYRDPRAPDEVLELVGLTDKADQRVKQLSGGQQRRIDLALGIIGNPEVLFLDEPTTGFDPAARRKSWDLVAGLRSVGTTILLTTHYMDEAQHLADRVAVLVNGRIVAEGSPTELMEAAGDTVITFKLPEGARPDGLPLDDVVFSAAGVTARTRSPTRALHELTGWALENHLELMDLSASRPTLEDVYLELAEREDHS